MIAHENSDQSRILWPLEMLGALPVRIDGTMLAEFNKMRGQYVRKSEQLIKPATCCLCGRERTSYCNSHSIPVSYLKSIAKMGFVLSTAVPIGTNLKKASIGVNQAGTFRFICEDCDNHLFKGYENPSSFIATPNQRIMGQIALKTCLYEMSKALKDQVMEAEVGADFNDDRMIRKSYIRGIDAKEDQKNLDLARRAAERGARSYKLIYYRVLNYTVPLAFQTAINPLVDLEGTRINDLFNPNPSYTIEPLYACAFPMKGKSVMLLFRNRRTSRYDQFDQQFANLSDEEKGTALLKLVLAYREEVFFSPAIEHVLSSDHGLARITRMNIDSLALFGALDTGNNPYSLASEAAGSVYSLNALPTIPNLLGPEFALEESEA